MVEGAGSLPHNGGRIVEGSTQHGPGPFVCPTRHRFHHRQTDGQRAFLSEQDHEGRERSGIPKEAQAVDGRCPDPEVGVMEGSLHQGRHRLRAAQAAEKGSGQSSPGSFPMPEGTKEFL